jgi:hypothetical protein
MGLVPSKRSMEKVGATSGLALVMLIPIISCCSAIMAWITGNTKVITVLHAYPAGAYIFGFVDGYLHGKRRYHQTQATIAIHHSGARRFMNDANIGRGIHALHFPQTYIAAEAGNTMRIDAAQIGAQQHFSGQCRLLCRTSYLFKNILCEFG